MESFLVSVALDIGLIWWLFSWFNPSGERQLMASGLNTWTNIWIYVLMDATYECPFFNWYFQARLNLVLRRMPMLLVTVLRYLF